MPTPSQAQPRAGIWSRHPALTQMLGLCPLLAISTTLTKAFALALATSAVLVATALLVSLARHGLQRELRLIAQLAIIAALVSTVDLVLRAFFFELHTQLGIFVPLIASNCLLLARAEHYSAGHGPITALGDALRTALGFTLVFVALGASRELLGRGSLFHDIALLVPGGEGLVLVDGGFLLASLPPGAFFALALLFAATRALESRASTAASTQSPAHDSAPQPR